MNLSVSMTKQTMNVILSRSLSVVTEPFDRAQDRLSRSSVEVLTGDLLNVCPHHKIPHQEVKYN